MAVYDSICSVAAKAQQEPQAPRSLTSVTALLSLGLAQVAPHVDPLGPGVLAPVVSLGLEDILSEDEEPPGLLLLAGVHLAKPRLKPGELIEQFLMAKSKS